nr:twin-arginine translocation signal domain-containing protein [Saprospiraceae bacterium]
MSFNINRRAFLKTSSAALALSTLGANGLDIIYPAEARRVGLIGTGWYGKSDLFRLIQVAPVDVVAICDPDQH